MPLKIEDSQLQADLEGQIQGESALRPLLAKGLAKSKDIRVIVKRKVGLFGLTDNAEIEDIRFGSVHLHITFVTKKSEYNEVVVTYQGKEIALPIKMNVVEANPVAQKKEEKKPEKDQAAPASAAPVQVTDLEKGLNGLGVDELTPEAIYPLIREYAKNMLPASRDDIIDRAIVLRANEDDA